MRTIVQVIFSVCILHPYVWSVGVMSQVHKTITFFQNSSKEFANGKLPVKTIF